MRLCVAVLIGLCACIFADFKPNPDPNTIWCEDGTDIALSNKNSASAWNNSALDIQSCPDGGFSIAPRDGKKGHSTGRYVTLSREYPWTVFEITAVDDLNIGYIGYNFPWYYQATPYGIVSNPRTGYFVYNVFENAPKLKDSKSAFLRLDLYGVRLHFKYIKQVKMPDFRIEVTSPVFAKKGTFTKGDKLTFTVFLREPAEDVTIRFYNAYTLPALKIADSDVLQLKPLTNNDAVWTTNATVGDLGPNKINAGKIVMEAIILGGNMPDSVWSAIPYSYQPPEKP